MADGFNLKNYQDQEANHPDLVDTYLDWANDQSPMTPDAFHRSAILWAVSTLISRRLKINLGFGEVYPNLYVLWLAKTTVYRKTTSMDIARDLLRPWRDRLAPQSVTPEVLMLILSGDMDVLEDSVEEEFPAQKGWIRDEMSGLLAEASRDYGSSLVETILGLYDCPDSYRRATTGDGLQQIENAYLTMFGASTPAAMSEYLNDQELWTNGFWPRWIVLTPPDGKPEYEEATMPDKGDEKALREALHTIDDRLPTPGEARSVLIDESARELWDDYKQYVSHDFLFEIEDHRLEGFYSRLPVHTLSVAMILSAMEWEAKTTAPKITVPIMDEAIRTAEVWRVQHLHSALSTADETQLDRIQNRILNLLKKDHPEGRTYREFRQSIRDVEKEQIKEALGDLEDMNYIEQRKKATGGRPREEYVLITE